MPKKIQKRCKNPTSTQIARERYQLKQNILGYCDLLSKKIASLKTKNLDNLSKERLKELFDMLFWLNYQLKHIDLDIQGR